MTTQDLRHHNRTVIVTGGSSGIGRGVAIRFAEEGANIIIADIRESPKQGNRYETDMTTPTANVINNNTPGSAKFVETDISDSESVASMIETTIESYSRLDVVVNNAGIQIVGDSQTITIEQWQRSLEIDLDGYFYTAKYAIPHIVEQNGQIINIGSVRGFEGGGGPPYAAAKGGVVNLTRDLAMELGDESVRVNCINPGYIETPLQDIVTEDDFEESQAQTLLSRFGTPRDVANVAVFLASEEAGFITGANIPVDGGWLAHSRV
jgi:Dehydrogenases with different specificities (related to short-chain alcohol dehydrogenases)